MTYFDEVGVHDEIALQNNSAHTEVATVGTAIAVTI
jgi:hypothetical protein